ncbi:hypothetical protein E1B28_004817 [Marasmius oreades]|uniref:Uncharacterized protein n=1 Tax=Marasmius oreades TaxID=181124 RepID=A0A9P7UZG7_9AGAR|nr:uncharacterized protein E1B28_004817 [Marasmius oreades]KAG7097474.1 hypothetical protein E1B28_004817 [Marasmius oreades]
MAESPSNVLAQPAPARPWHSRVPFIPTKARPPPSSVDDAHLIPEVGASWFSILTFSWMTPILVLGYARPLEITDLYRLSDKKSTEVYAESIIESFERRRHESDAYNQTLDDGTARPPPHLAFWWILLGNREERTQLWRKTAKRKTPSLALACNDAVYWWFGFGGLCRLLADVGIMTSPLLVKAIIEFARESHEKLSAGEGLPSIGPGVSLAIGLWAIQVAISLLNAQAYHRGYTTGVILRAALIHALFSRSLKLTSRTRSTRGLTAGRLTSMISTDVSRIDFCMAYFHMAFTAPIQMIICLIILCINLGYSALPGFAFFLLFSPLQGRITKMLFVLRKRSMVWTDRRISLLQELLGSMRIIKLFAWELPFLERVEKFRTEEMRFLRSRLMFRSINNALAFALPTLSAVLSFIAFALTGHVLEPSVIFSSLSLFNLLRTPLTFLPVSLSSMADAYNAVARVQEVFVAELMTKNIRVDLELDVAVSVKDAHFTWDAPPPTSKQAAATPATRPINKVALRKVKKPFNKKSPHTSEELAEQQPNEKHLDTERRIFRLRNINLSIPRGQLCAIVGPIGAGKSSLLQGLVGEMHKAQGEVVFGERVGYCPQSAWIQSTTIRDNITFGQHFDEEKYWKVVQAACLLPDLEMLTPGGDLTEIGEKGISLSGGQKQRINIARALYFGSKITLFDDPLSALDAQVAKDVFKNVMQDALAGTTRIVVTHALHFLPHMDYIITLNNGVVVEEGSYSDLMAKRGTFARFIEEFGSNGSQHDLHKKGARTDAKENTTDTEAPKNDKPTKKLMQLEDRNVGSVSFKTYMNFFRAGHLPFTFPLFLVAVLFFQGSSVLSPYWLVWWQQETFSFGQGIYMAIYAILGFAQAFGLFSMGAVFALFTFNASRTLHRNALKRVMHAPVSFFDTTPLGRIMNRFSKDVDTLDNIVGEAMRQFLGTIVQVIGSIILVSVIIPWFLIAIVFILVLYYWITIFYRASARELKRLDAVLRSSLYSHFSESMSGLTTIRAYGESIRFCNENASRTDLENRAYWLSVSNQRWLSIRLDFLGSIMVFAVAIMAVGTRLDISPAQTGAVLSYMLVVQQAFGWAVRQSAEVENNMNAVERILYYSHAVEQEPPHELPENKPPPQWPKAGSIEMSDVVVSYRPGLPPVLKGVTLDVRGGEHIGIVGRTGAGKSTITVTLYRIIELISGSIKIDGVDISKIGLADLRKALAIIPQEPILFSGDLRSNLDPFGQYDDAVLWDALRRSWLLDTAKTDRLSFSSASTVYEVSPNRLTLDSKIEEGGCNLSVGQRSLVSLARALVKNSKIIIMDEATASVDFETDRNIQDTIQTEFADRTLLCVAHRLRTIIGYDRVCVLDAGQVKEFDSPEALWAKGNGIFRGMCESSGISLADIETASQQNKIVKNML